MISPIPRALLPHSGTLKKVTGKDAWGAETYGIYNLQYVRIEPVDSRRYQMSAEMPEIRAKLFFDAFSSVCSADIEAGDTIIINSKEYKVQSVKDYYAEAELHHRECELI